MVTNEELALAIQAGDRALLPQLWEQTRLFVYKAANRYYNRLGDRCAASGVTVEDLHQEGYLALLDAVRAYDGRFGFLAYIKYPLLNRWNAMLGIRGSRRDALNQCDSLDNPIPGAEDLTLADTIPDPDAATAFECAEDAIFTQQLHTALERAIDTLAEPEGVIVRGEHFEGRRVKDIAATLGVSYSRCQQMRHQAFRVLRRGKALRYLQQYRDIIQTTAYRGGVGGFRHTHTSSTEWAAIRLEEMKTQLRRPRRS